MFVNNGLVGVFNATELIDAVYKANKGGLDSLNSFSVDLFITCEHSAATLLQYGTFIQIQEFFNSVLFNPGLHVLPVKLWFLQLPPTRQTHGCLSLYVDPDTMVTCPGCSWPLTQC